MGNKYVLVNLLIVDTYNNDEWFKNGKLTDASRKSDKEESDMPPLESDEEEVKEGNRLKITRNKLLTQLPILIAQIKAGNNSFEQKMKSGKYYIFFISIIKSPKQFTTI